MNAGLYDRVVGQIGKPHFLTIMVDMRVQQHYGDIEVASIGRIAPRSTSKDDELVDATAIGPRRGRDEELERLPG